MNPMRSEMIEGVALGMSLATLTSDDAAWSRVTDPELVIDDEESWERSDPAVFVAAFGGRVETIVYTEHCRYGGVDLIGAELKTIEQIVGHGWTPTAEGSAILDHDGWCNVWILNGVVASLTLKTPVQRGVPRCVGTKA